MSSEARIKLAIFASGGGSNADKICTYFASNADISVELIASNRKAAGVFHIAEAHGIESQYLPKTFWEEPILILNLLLEREITHIVLAGFLLHIPTWLISAFPHRIINIHPSLLPKHGGKGMYGHHVHEAVKQAGELVSGITIHEVNEQYDEGKIVFQKKVELAAEDSAEEIARKVLKTEHAYYAPVIEAWVNGTAFKET